MVKIPSIFSLQIQYLKFTEESERARKLRPGATVMRSQDSDTTDQLNDNIAGEQFAGGSSGRPALIPGCFSKVDEEALLG